MPCVFVGPSPRQTVSNSGLIAQPARSKMSHPSGRKPDAFQTCVLPSCTRMRECHHNSALKMVYTARILSGEVTMCTSSKNANTLSEQQRHHGVPLFAAFPLCNVVHHTCIVLPNFVYCHRTGERKVTQKDTNWPTLATLLRETKSNAPIPSMDRIVALGSNSLNDWRA